MAMLDGQHAVVTGGGRGLGRAIAAALAGAGAAVTVIGRNEATLADAVERGLPGAISSPMPPIRRALGAGLQRAAAERGRVGILVANAGGAESAPVRRHRCRDASAACSSSTP